MLSPQPFSPGIEPRTTLFLQKGATGVCVGFKPRAGRGLGGLQTGVGPDC